MHKPAVLLLNVRGPGAQLARFRRSFWGGIFTEFNAIYYNKIEELNRIILESIENELT